MAHHHHQQQQQQQQQPFMMMNWMMPNAMSDGMQNGMMPNAMADGTYPPKKSLQLKLIEINCNYQLILFCERSPIDCPISKISCYLCPATVPCVEEECSSFEAKDLSSNVRLLF
jgi:hypothetical protein